MIIQKFFFGLGSIFIFIIQASLIDDQSQEFIAARCYSRCLKTFIKYKQAISSQSKSGPENFTRSSKDDKNLQLSFVHEIALQLQLTKTAVLSCMNDTNNVCSNQCIQSCNMVGECICQPNDAGCILACYNRKEIAKESGHEDCSSVSSSDINLKVSIAQCPPRCKSKFGCNPNQICCPTETCGTICIPNENKTISLPKYQPVSTQPNSSVNIEFDWSSVFKPYLSKESPLVFILQTRSCLCYKFKERYLTPWETLIRTHRLGAKLNTFERGTIYQFRLAAVTDWGTNGFGPVSPNWPTIISKPPPPLPPENLIDYKWQISDDNRFKVEIKWKKFADPFWRIYEFLVSWMVDHGVAQPDGEPLSSLTQYSKTLIGTEESCTIDELKPSTTYKIQIVVRVYWSGYGNINSIPSTLYISTPATNEAINMRPEINGNAKNKECSCPEKILGDKEPKIRHLNALNRNSQVIIKMEKYSDYLVEIYPEVCINLRNENLSRSLFRYRKLYKQTAQITLTNLRFSCRYSVNITPVSQSLSNITTYHLCFCTSSCTSNYLYTSKNCNTEDISIPSPKEPKSELLDLNTMTYSISWKTPYRISPRKRNYDITKYRISWAPRKYEPVRIEHYLGSSGMNPIIDYDQSDVKIVFSNVSKFDLRNLTKQQLYVVKIQSLGLTSDGEIIESFPATILVPTYGYSEDFYTKSSQKTNTIHIVILLFYFLFLHLWAS